MTISKSWLSKSAISLGVVWTLGLVATASLPRSNAADLPAEPMSLPRASALGGSDYARAWNLGRLGATVSEDAPDHDKASFDAWQVLSTRMDFALNYHQPAVDASLRRYLENPSTLQDAIPHAALYLPYITGRMMASDLPPELALLPFVESAYNPSARSPSGASGLWQITPATADLLGLKRNRWYDGRDDIIRSTDAAIAYLSYLNRKFDGDWLLSLAAYNSGEGTVARAVSANHADGKDTDFWALNLPRQARSFVPKFLALARIFQDVDHAQSLDFASAAEPPELQALVLPRQISLARAAQLADIDYELIKRLNTGLKRGVTPPEGPHRLVLPGAAAERLLAAVAATQSQ